MHCTGPLSFLDRKIEYSYWHRGVIVTPRTSSETATTMGSMIVMLSVCARNMQDVFQKGKSDCCSSNRDSDSECIRDL